jgi:hypothetical protein
MIIVTGAEICARCHAAGEPATADMIESKTRRLGEKAVYHRSHQNHSAWAPVAFVAQPKIPDIISASTPACARAVCVTLATPATIIIGTRGWPPNTDAREFYRFTQAHAN